MPSLTAFSWSPPQTESLMQICGMKRKTEDTHTGDSAMQEQVYHSLLDKEIFDKGCI